MSSLTGRFMVLSLRLSTTAAVVVAMFGVLTSAQISNCRSPDPYTFDGVVTPCNPATQCDWCNRNQYSLDFLCCGDVLWAASHFGAPLFIMLYTKSIAAAYALPLIYEVVEALGMVLFGATTSFASFFTVETLAEALIGDVLIPASLAIAIGYAINVIFVLPVLVSSAERVGKNDAKNTRRYVYWASLVVIILLAFFIGWRPSGNPVGLYIYFGAVLLVFAAFLVYSQDDNALIWELDSGTITGSARIALFFVVAGVVCAACIPLFFTPAASTLGNLWYDQWMALAIAYGVLALVAGFMSVARQDIYSAIMILGMFFGLIALGSMIIYHVTGYTAIVVAAFIVLVIALVTFVAAQYYMDQATEVPYVGPKAVAPGIVAASMRRAKKSDDDDTETKLLENTAHDIDSLSRDELAKLF